MLFSRSPLHPARSALVATLTLAALAVCCATARAAGSVRIVPVSGAGAQTVDLSQLLGKPDVTQRSYSAVAAPGGTPHTVMVRSGYSLPKLLEGLEALHSISSSFGSVEVVAPEGPAVVLNNAQATSRFAYPEGPPIVWEDGAGAHLLVPPTPTGTTNAGETFTGAGGTITIALHRAQPLSVGISADPLKAFVGKPVQFNPKVYGGVALVYQWSFGDSTTGSAADPAHTYTATGTYNVYLQVSGSEDSVGASSVTHIVVGNPPPRTGGHGGASGGKGTGSSGGAGTQGSGTTKGTATTPAHRARTKRSVPHRAQRAPRPVGPLVSGIAISYVTQPAGGTSSAGAARSRAARTAHLSASATALGEGLWIALGTLVMLFGGALLEWRGPCRARSTIAELP